MWISRGGWKKYQKLIVRGVGIVGGVEKPENFSIWGEVGVGFSIASFLPFLIMKTTLSRIFVYTVKVEQKQK